MKKLFSIIVLSFYVFFSQFAIKAVATTQLTDQSGDEIVCVSKKLNTLDGKQDCREKHNSASFTDVFEYSTYILEKWIAHTPYHYSLLESSSGFFSLEYLAQAPPWSDEDDRWILHQIYAHTYVWIILLLD